LHRHRLAAARAVAPARAAIASRFQERRHP
jgi:hypothetical protein